MPHKRSMQMQRVYRGGEVRREAGSAEKEGVDVGEDGGHYGAADAVWGRKRD